MVKYNHGMKKSIKQLESERLDKPYAMDFLNEENEYRKRNKKVF